MNYFNKFVNNGRATLNKFPGASSKEMIHHVLPTLKDSNFDTAIIHVGINDLVHNCTENSQTFWVKTFPIWNCFLLKKLIVE